MSPSPSIENGLAESAVGNRSCKIIWIVETRNILYNPFISHLTRSSYNIEIHIEDGKKKELFIFSFIRKPPTFIGASKDFATLTITGVKKTQKMSYTKSPA